MKKVYLSILALSMTAIGVNAQVVGTETQAAPAKISTAPSSASNEVGYHAPANNSRAAGDTIWIDEFEDAGNWNFIPPSGSPDPAVNGWSIGNEIIGWRAFDPFETEGNYARFVNGDPTVDPATTINEGPWIFEYTGTVPDLTGISAPQLMWEQYGARFVTHQAVEFSTDGGATWQTAGSNDNIDPLTAAGGSEYDNPMTRAFNITDVIANDPSNVMIRLIWDGLMNGPEMNYVEYAWFVDNLRIVEGVDNDLIVTGSSHDEFWDFNTAENFLNLEYTVYPVSEVRELTPSVAVYNNGANEQTNTILTVIVTDGASYNETFVSAPISVASGASDTISVAFTPPAEVGTYTLAYSVTSDYEDENPIDNVAAASFVISDATYARDAGSQTGAFTNFTLDYKLGTTFEVSAEETLYCIGAALSNESVTGASFNMELLDKNTAEYDYIAETLILEVPVGEFLNENGTGIFTWQYMDSPVMLLPGEAYLPVVNHFGGDDDVVVSLSGTSPAQTSNFYDGADATWYYVTSTPMVRMGLSQEFCDAVVVVGVDEVEVVNNHNLYPNPTEGATTLEYTLLENSDVQLYLFDVQGRIVMNEEMGTQTAGQYRFDYDFSHLSSGQYTMSLQVDGKPINSKLVIK